MGPTGTSARRGSSVPTGTRSGRCCARRTSALPRRSIALPDLLVESTEARPNSRQEEAAGVKAAPRARARAFTLVRGFTGVALLAIIWEVAPRTGLIDPYFVPPLSHVLLAWW